MSPQESIGHYLVKSKLGEGGMGTVYRATDTKLNRDVAIKVLPDSFAQDPDRLARFTREAQVLASLNHPNIAAIHGVEERAIVMELVEGQTLAGPLSAEEALPIVYQLIDALEYAHEKGIVHRDLKPTNIKVTPEGRVKVLDFGLAKAMATDPTAADPAASPTLTMRATMAGVIMGTAAYMSPEQARGQTVDKRADIWAFGVVVYEVLTGKPLFEGPSVSDTLAAVLRQEPDLKAVPLHFRRLVRTCLVRDPRQRMRDISGARLLLEEPLAAAAPAASRLWIFAAAVLFVLLAAGVLLSRRPSGSPAPVRRFTLAPQALASPVYTSNAVISPDGKRIAYTADGRLWARELDREDARPLPGTEGALGPFWSPSGDTLGFTARDRLWRVSVAGGAPVSLCPINSSTAFGGDWSPDGKTIVVTTQTSGLFTVPANGGDPKPIYKSPSEAPLVFAPHFLPGEFGSGWVLASEGDLTQQKIVAVNLHSNERREIGAGRFAVWSSTGHLVFFRASAAGAGLWAMPLSHDLKPAGDAFPVAAGGGHPSVSRDGTLVYTDSSRQMQMVFRERSGNRVGLAGTPQSGMATVAVSPDGKSIAVNSNDQGTMDIWVHDLEHSSKRRVTIEGLDSRYPKWSPDGRQLLFRHGGGIAVKAADGTGKASVVYTSNGTASPGDWSRDGKYILFSIVGARATASTDIWYLKQRPEGGFEPAPLVETPFEESSPRQSPDGRYFAYVANDTGRFEVYVQPFPGGAGKWQISTIGGNQPRWSRDGKELYFLQGTELMAVTVATAGAFQFGSPKRLFSVENYLVDRSSLKYDVTPDGRFLVLDYAEGEKPNGIHIVENWLMAAREGAK